MIRGTCHLLLDAARRSSIRSLSRRHWSIYRLLDRPRWTAGIVAIGGRDIRYIDGLSTFYQWVDIFREGTLGFRGDGPSPLIVDAGANVGLATLFWQSSFPRPEIIAVEPCSLAYRCLERNVGGHPGTTLLHKALWSVAGPVPFREHADDTSRIVPTGGLGDQGTVDAITLGSLLGGCEREIDFLKIDIEGAEVDVLREARSHLPRVRRLFVEYHQFAERRQRLSELLGMIEDAGFAYVIDASRRVPETFDRGAAKESLLFTANIYADRVSDS